MDLRNIKIMVQNSRIPYILIWIMRVPQIDLEIIFVIAKAPTISSRSATACA